MLFMHVCWIPLLARVPSHQGNGAVYALTPQGGRSEMAVGVGVGACVGELVPVAINDGHQYEVSKEMTVLARSALLEAPLAQSRTP